MKIKDLNLTTRSENILKNVNIFTAEECRIKLLKGELSLRTKGMGRRTFKEIIDAVGLSHDGICPCCNRPLGLGQFIDNFERQDQHTSKPDKILSASAADSNQDKVCHQNK